MIKITKHNKPFEYYKGTATNYKAKDILLEIFGVLILLVVIFLLVMFVV